MIDMTDRDEVVPVRYSPRKTPSGRHPKNGFRSRLRSTLKGTAEKVLSSGPILHALRKRARGAAVILAYHNVIPDNEVVSGSPSVHLTLTELQWQLDIIGELCTVESLEKLVRETGPSDAFRVAITFDDAYLGTLREAIPEVSRRGFPVTVFVPTGLVGGGAFWWDEFGITGWEDDRIPLNQLSGEADRIRKWASQTGLVRKPQGPNQEAGSEGDLLGASRLPNVSFGVHTIGHPNLAQLAPSKVVHELRGADAWIRSRSLPRSNVVAYPYGLASPLVEKIARDLGFLAGLTISGGWLPPKHQNRFRLPRLLVPASISRENFLLRLLGVLGG